MSLTKRQRRMWTHGLRPVRPKSKHGWNGERKALLFEERVQDLLEPIRPPAINKRFNKTKANATQRPVKRARNDAGKRRGKRAKLGAD